MVADGLAPYIARSLATMVLTQYNRNIYWTMVYRDQSNSHFALSVYFMPCKCQIESILHIRHYNAPFYNRNVHISVTDWCIVGYGTGASWDLWIRSSDVYKWHLFDVNAFICFYTNCWMIEIDVLCVEKVFMKIPVIFIETYVEHILYLFLYPDPVLKRYFIKISDFHWNTLFIFITLTNEVGGGQYTLYSVSVCFGISISNLIWTFPMSLFGRLRMANMSCRTSVVKQMQSLFILGVRTNISCVFTVYFSVNFHFFRVISLSAVSKSIAFH